MQVLENASTEYSSTATQEWKKQVRKIQVRVSRVGKCKYGKIEYEIAMQLLEIRLCFSCVFHFNDTQDKGIRGRDVFKENAGTGT